MYTNAEVADVLSQGAQRLATRKNWGQGPLDGFEDCLLTAAAECASAPNLRDRVELAVASFLGLPIDGPIGTTIHNVIAWNDHPGRTAAEVIQVMQDCAEKLRMSEEA